MNKGIGLTGAVSTGPSFKFILEQGRSRKGVNPDRKVANSLMLVINWLSTMLHDELTRLSITELKGEITCSARRTEQEHETLYPHEKGYTLVHHGQGGITATFSVHTSIEVREEIAQAVIAQVVDLIITHDVTYWNVLARRYKTKQIFALKHHWRNELFDAYLDDIALFDLEQEILEDYRLCAAPINEVPCMKASLGFEH